MNYFSGNNLTFFPFVKLFYEMITLKSRMLSTALLVCIATFLVQISNAEFTTEDCASLGFIKANLLCSSCDQLKDFGLEQLMSHCKECCHQDETAPKEKKYARAILEVCTCKFPAYPQIQAFVKSDRPAKFPNLQIKYVRGLDPIIKLLDKDGIVKDTVAIEKWNTDSVEEFLKAHLENEEDDEPDYLKTNRI